MGAGSLSEAMSLANAAWSEGARARTSELDVEHVLAGIAANGGEAARILGQAGITLVGIRDATRRMRDRHLAALGVDPSTLPSRAPRPIDELHHAATGDIPMSQRYRALTTGRDAASGITLLRAVIDEPSGCGRDVLTEAGADLEMLRRIIDASDAPTPGWRIVPARRDLLGDGRVGKAVEVRRFVSAPPAVVAAVASREVFGGTYFEHGEKRGHVFRPEVADESIGDDARRIVWVQRVSGGKRRLDAVVWSYVEITATPTPGGSEIVVAAAHRLGTGLRGRLLGTLLPSVTSTRMRLWQIVRGLVMACAEETAA